MARIYILGAGFSKTCDIATDTEMLNSLRPLLVPAVGKSGGTPRTTIDHLIEQNFSKDHDVGFELFMSTLSSLKFMEEYINTGGNIFREEELEIREALCAYLNNCVRNVNWQTNGSSIVDFMRLVNWDCDFVLTFNYDLLLEAAATRLGIEVSERVIHLHGAINERTLALPTYTKFAYRTTKSPLAARWKKAFGILRDQAKIEKLVFLGYSMPPSDLEARSLFNYTDWYNGDNNYSYQIVVVNPNREISRHYEFFRKPVKFVPLTFEKWLHDSTDTGNN